MTHSFNDLIKFFLECHSANMIIDLVAIEWNTQRTFQYKALNKQLYWPKHKVIKIYALTHSYPERNCSTIHFSYMECDHPFWMSQFISMNNNFTAWKRKNKPIIEMRVDDQVSSIWTLKKTTNTTINNNNVNNSISNNASNCRTGDTITVANTLRDIFYAFWYLLPATTLSLYPVYWVW